MASNFFSIFLFLFVCAEFVRSNRTPRQSYSSVTNVEINDSIQRLEKNIRILENKLSRHEFREAQVADFSTKTLNALTADHGRNRRNMQTVAKQLGKLEERLLSLEALIRTTDERQRKKLDSLSEGIDRLIMSKSGFGGDLPPFPGGGNPLSDNELKDLVGKVERIQETLHQNTKSVVNEVNSVGTSLDKKIEKLGHGSCNNDQINSLTQISSALSTTSTTLNKQVNEAKKLMKNSKCAAGPSSDIVNRLDSLDRAYRDQERDRSKLNEHTMKMLQEQGTNIEYLMKETTSEKEMLSKRFNDVYKNLNELDTHSKDRLGGLETLLNDIIIQNSQELQKSLDLFKKNVMEHSGVLLTAVEDSASIIENLHQSMNGNFDDLTKNVRGLKKVEQVMLNTADAVLDTKRSIEFGIQQVILELSDTVKNSGKNINSTLSDQINNISFHILKNQTAALTNMTRKMEDEISQVWRQIGIMYQQISQSVDILGDLQNTTSRQMNASLSKVGTMDGTVGAINNKVADVEDNLNYLLGRLTLVVSEFSHMKSGVGLELQKLREMAEEFSSKDGVVEYEVKAKRSIQDLHYHK